MYPSWYLILPVGQVPTSTLIFVANNHNDFAVAGRYGGADLHGMLFCSDKQPTRSPHLLILSMSSLVDIHLFGSRSNVRGCDGVQMRIPNGTSADSPARHTDDKNLPCVGVLIHRFRLQSTS
jgi:hypothetical protein